ncbi:MAG: hypothetical protein ACLGH0_15515 [Thermoanaerobaculia bacterium]
MHGSRWKDALWNLLDVLALRRLTARVALSASLAGLATQAAPESSATPRVPITPAFQPDATVRRFKGRYVLKRTANSFFVHLAGHRSHNSHRSHSSHSSHRSHSSSSHYSGAHASHYSSSSSPSRSTYTPPPEPPPPPPPPPPRPLPPPKPQPLFRDRFSDAVPAAYWWNAGAVTSELNGYISGQAFDLNSATIAVKLARPAAGATTIFAAAIDAQNWIGFRIEDGQLSMESHIEGKVAARTVPYSPAQHRFLRLRLTRVATVVLWETSADGKNWSADYAETPLLKLNNLRIAFSTGTAQHLAALDEIVVEPLS